VPLVLDALRDDRRQRNLLLLARLKSGVSLNQAQSAMDIAARQIAAEHPDTNSGWGITLVPLRDQVMGRFRLTLIVLLAAVGFVLLIGCANIGNLLLARAAGRHKEIAVRTALGASRLDLASQFLMESCVLAGLGGLLGVAIGAFSLEPLLKLIPDAAGVPFLSQVTIDANVLACSAAVSMLCAVLFGLAPLREARGNVNEVLKDTGRSNTGGARGGRLRGALVVGQVAFCVILLAGAGLMIQTLLHLQKLNPGFEPRHLLTLRTAVRGSDYNDPHMLANFYRQMVNRMAAIPGVESAGAIDFGPPTGTIRSFHFKIADQPSAPGQEPSALSRVAHYGYFRAMRIPLLGGRAFDEHDQPDSPGVAVVSQSLARRYWSSSDPIGKIVQIEGDKKGPRQIVGIVGDVRSAGADPTPRPVIYVPLDQDPMGTMSIMLRTSGDPTSLASTAGKLAQLMDPGMAVYGVQTMEETLDDADWQPRFTSQLLAGLALLALSLATFGIYSVVSYSVSQRVREIGIRMALGAGSKSVFALIIGNGLRLTLAGTVIGLGGAVALGSLMRGLLFDVQPADPSILLGVATVLLAVAAFACYVPARRASRMDPLIAMRDE
jgi:putative ABC transport system permease protein